MKNEDSLLANTVARTGGEGLQDSLSVVIKDRIVVVKPTLRDERVGFGEVAGGEIRRLLGDVDKSLSANQHRIIGIRC